MSRFCVTLGRALGIGIAGVASIGAFGASDLKAQTQLPEIVVTAPKPLKKKPVRTPAAGGSQDAPAASEPAKAAPPPEPDQGFVAVDVLTLPGLLAQPSGQLGDALATQPGIASTSFAPGASRPIIRGLSGFRVGITENGLKSGDVSALSDDHAIPIDPNAVRQVEVVRGPRPCATARRPSAGS